MSLLVTGSIGIDTVEAPTGKVVNALGGSSIYFAYAASFFSPVRLVGVVGDDCPTDFLKPLMQNPRIDMAGLEIRKGSKTFRWHGKYHADVNNRDTVGVELNVLAERGPTSPRNSAIASTSSWPTPTRRCNWNCWARSQPQASWWPTRWTCGSARNGRPS